MSEVTEQVTETSPLIAGDNLDKPSSMGNKVSGALEQVKQKMSPIASSVITSANNKFKQAAPYLEKLYSTAKNLNEKHHLSEWSTAFFGFVLVFAGGYFLTVVAIIEAVNLVGLDKIKAHVDKLYRTYTTARDAALKDQAESPKKAASTTSTDSVSAASPETNNSPAMAKGKDMIAASIKPITAWAQNEDNQRLILVVLKSTNPEEVLETVASLYGIILTVYATLNNWMAQCITLGSALGTMLYEPVLNHLKPKMEEKLPKELHKNINTYVRFGCQFIGVYLAFSIRTTIATVQCSLRGAHMLVVNGQATAVRLGYLKKQVVPESSPLFYVVINGFAAWGVFRQFF